jgi:antitoxin component of MazEF toxin-antitoxin module
MPLTKKVQAVGGSLGLVLPKPIADQHDLKLGSEVEIIDLVEGVFILPVKKGAGRTKRQRVAALVAETVVTHRRTLEKLAK